MAKLDLTKIPGFENLSSEAQEALKNYEIPDPDYSGYVRKDVFDKTASQLAALKEKNNALLSEDEKKRQAAEDELNQLRSQVEEMRREKIIAGHKANYLALGYDEDLASDTAAALMEGNTDRVFENQKKFLESHDTRYKAQLMGAVTAPPAGQNASPAPTYEKMINDAQAAGDYAAVAYYTRLAAQEQK